MMDANKVYNDFIDKYKDYPRKLWVLITKQRSSLPVNIEDENYNMGTMQRDDDVGISPNISVMNAFSFKKSFDDYKANNPQMPETEIKARVVFDFLAQHGGGEFSYEKNKDDILFGDITRENFYANAIYQGALTNTNYYARHVGNAQVLCLEPKSSAGVPRNIDGISQESLNKFMNISEEERLEILYKRGLYHESIHMAMGTDDERKCDAFALLKIMREHPNHAKEIFDIYNIQRSKMGYTVGALREKKGASKQRAIKGGVMTYLMPNTYKKLEQYALNPSLIPENDAGILELTCKLTSEPEFSKEQLAAYMELMQRDNLTPQDLADNEVVQSCMRQGGFKDINEYIASDRKLSDIVTIAESSIEHCEAITEDCKKTQNYINNETDDTSGKSKGLDEMPCASRSIAELRGIGPQTTIKPIRKTTLNVSYKRNDLKR